LSTKSGESGHFTLGQDPYHGPGQAHGYLFSSNPEFPFPPSLLNIFTEIKDRLSIDMPPNGDLTVGQIKRVFLLNATLMFEAHEAGSHQGKRLEELQMKSSE